MMLLSNYHPSPPPHHQHHNWNHNKSLWLLSPLSPPPGEQRSILFPRWCTRMIRPSHSSCFPSSLGSMENSTALCMCSASHYHEYVDVSENSGTPQIIHFNRVFHCKPSILGYHYFWKHPGATLDLHIPYPYPARIKFKKAMAAPSNNLSDDIKWFVIFLGGGCLQIPESAMIVAGRVDEAKLGPPFCRNCRNLHLNVHVSDIQQTAMATKTWRPWYPQPDWCWKPMLLFVFISLFDPSHQWSWQSIK